MKPQDCCKDMIVIHRKKKHAHCDSLKVTDKDLEIMRQIKAEMERMKYAGMRQKDGSL
jgi:hypothetical protein